MLNYNVLGISLELPQTLEYKPGQWALIDYKDPDQPLKRAYSIVEYKITDNGCQITLAIKLNEGSKSSDHLKKAKEGDFLEVLGIFGHFVLQENDNPKVFIGTGTGLAPLISMANTTKANKSLYFSVSYKSDLFYVDRINNIKNLQSHIHVTREEVNGCESGRIDISKIEAPENSEFYICGNPTIVVTLTNDLQSRGFKNIYTEKY